MKRAHGPIALMAAMAISTPGAAQTIRRGDAWSAAIHPVGDAAEMMAWLSRVPVTRDWPPDFAETLGRQAPMLMIETSTSPGCLPCAHVWKELGIVWRRYGITVRTIDAREAMVRSGRLGLPWVGHPVVWVRQTEDDSRIVPIAIGTDHAPNLARNIYLAAKMLAGVRPAVGLRGMAKFTGIVGSAAKGRAPR